MKTRIQLIVTGNMERQALHLSLRRLFASTDADVEFLPPLQAQDFTSNRVPALPPKEQLTRTRAAKLARALVAEVHSASGASPRQHYAFAIDDLELVNADQPQHVLDYFRSAVEAHVEEHFQLPAERNRAYGALCQRASFHLLVPMAEAYFFGEPASLVRAQATRADNRFDSARDLEDFEVNDPDYLQVPAPHGAPWATPGRHRHPKNYVRYLCDPTGQQPRAYRETHEGAAALQELDWPAVLRNPAHAEFARALIDDIADALGVQSPCPGRCAPLTIRRIGGLLRNL